MAFAEAIGFRTFFVQGLREGAIYLANSRVILLDVSLTPEGIKSAIDVALGHVDAPWE
jgi:hypothetical protein